MDLTISPPGRTGRKRLASRASAFAFLAYICALQVALLPRPRGFARLADEVGVALFGSAELQRAEVGPGDNAYFWEKAKNCHAVEDVCHSRDLQRWFYFDREERKRGMSRRPRQPSVALNLSEGIDGEPDHRVYFDVDAAAPKRPLSRLLDGTGARPNNCTLSPVKNHAVLQSGYNDMVGEFYARSLLPLGQLMANNATPATHSDYASDNLQFFVHLAEKGTKLLDAHELFLSGMNTNNDVRAWSDMFEGERASECECYARFVLCGYQRVENNNAACASELERIGLFGNATSTLCEKGIDLRALQRLHNETLLEEALRDAGIASQADRANVVRCIKEAPSNVALDKPTTASSSEESFPARHATDGKTNTRWSSEWKDEQWLEVDLEDMHRVEKAVITWEHASAENYGILVSTDGRNWTRVWSRTDGRKDMGTVESILNNVTCRYVRMLGHTRATSWGFSLFGFEVYGTRIENAQTNNTDFFLNAPEEAITLIAGGEIQPKGVSECRGYRTPRNILMRGGCESFAELRKSLLANYARKYPHLPKDIDAYRASVVREALLTLPDSERPNATNHRTWKLIGLTQRNKRRSWLNLNETIAHCNAQYHRHKIICVEVNVETMPSGPHTQLIVHRSLDGLIGIHGAQLTQAILLPKGAVVVELLPWAPSDYFGTGHKVWGEWTRSVTNPTPLGIIYHNSELNHLGYPLGRGSVPLCENASNTEMHDFSEEEASEDRERIETELEYCLHEEDDFRWDYRNFNVELQMIDRFMGSFLLPHLANSTVPVCSYLREHGERHNLVLYNVWCRESGNSSSASLQHYYWDGEDAPVRSDDNQIKSESSDNKSQESRREERKRRRRERRREEST